MSRKWFAAAALLAVGLGSRGVWAGPYLPAIQKGTISINLTPIATGMAAPDYAISPPGDPSRLFVLEQNGLVRIIQNGVLQPGAALDLGPRVQIAPVGNGPLNPGSPNDERGLLG